MSPENIYDVDKAKSLFERNKIDYKTLSIMKQENVREAIKDKRLSLRTIKEAICDSCSYCFKFSEKRSCGSCPLQFKKFLFFMSSCCEIKEWDEMVNARTYDDLLIAHQKWCYKLGIFREEKINK